MHGVPRDLKAKLPIGFKLDKILFSQFQVQFIFEKSTISVEGKWALADENKKIIIVHERESASEENLSILLEQKVLDALVEAPLSFTLIFENGYRLSIFDDSDQYESFSINNLFI